MHKVDELPAVTLLYLPAAQPVHAPVPVDSALYAPTIHTVHTAEVLAADKPPKLPAAQAVQADVPVVRALNMPDTHTVHTAEVLAEPTLL